jgi:hypothetical protein
MLKSRPEKFSVAVREVTAVRQVHAQHRVARFEEREVPGHVRLGARMGLHVHVLAPRSALARLMAVCSTSTHSQPP